MARKRKTNLKKVKRTKRQIGGLGSPIRSSQFNRMRTIANQQGQNVLDPTQTVPMKPLPEDDARVMPVPPRQQPRKGVKLEDLRSNPQTTVTTTEAKFIPGQPTMLQPTIHNTSFIPGQPTASRSAVPGVTKGEAELIKETGGLRQAQVIVPEGEPGYDDRDLDYGEGRGGSAYDRGTIPTPTPAPTPVPYTPRTPTPTPAPTPSPIVERGRQQAEDILAGRIQAPQIPDAVKVPVGEDIQAFQMGEVPRVDAATVGVGVLGV